jgi:hypothetical protein
VIVLKKVTLCYKSQVSSLVVIGRRPVLHFHYHIYIYIYISEFVRGQTMIFNVKLLAT